ncbi:DUF6458 family protein [Nocardioides yefusunii]|uniref:DUF6458 family protein n=1 Tax=Nocardioides yefusunii TaxID=2500546 RepID=A0ABW1QWY2_9ACTN|nr:DUF6458 family protein [Nocardioides yefusunii]
MGIVFGIILIVVGLVLALDVVSITALNDATVDSQLLGWILFGAGVLALVLTAWVAGRRKVTVVERPER